MTNTKKRVARSLAALAICGGSAAAIPTTTHADGLPPVVTINEWDRNPVDVSPPQRLDVRMIWTGPRSTTRRCEDMGGRLGSYAGYWFCVGVDY